MSELKIDDSIDSITHIYAEHDGEKRDLLIVNGQDIEHPIWTKPCIFHTSVIFSTGRALLQYIRHYIYLTKDDETNNTYFNIPSGILDDEIPSMYFYFMYALSDKNGNIEMKSGRVFIDDVRWHVHSDGHYYAATSDTYGTDISTIFNVPVYIVNSNGEYTRVDDDDLTDTTWIRACTIYFTNSASYSVSSSTDPFLKFELTGTHIPGNSTSMNHYLDEYKVVYGDYIIKYSKYFKLAYVNDCITFTQKRLTLAERYNLGQTQNDGSNISVDNYTSYCYITNIIADSVQAKIIVDRTENAEIHPVTINNGFFNIMYSEDITLGFEIGKNIYHCTNNYCTINDYVNDCQYRVYLPYSISFVFSSNSLNCNTCNIEIYNVLDDYVQNFSNISIAMNESLSSNEYKIHLFKENAISDTLKYDCHYECTDENTEFSENDIVDDCTYITALIAPEKAFELVDVDLDTVYGSWTLNGETVTSAHISKYSSYSIEDNNVYIYKFVNGVKTPCLTYTFNPFADSTDALFVFDEITGSPAEGFEGVAIGYTNPYIICTGSNVTMTLASTDSTITMTSGQKYYLTVGTKYTVTITASTGYYIYSNLNKFTGTKISNITVNATSVSNVLTATITAAYNNTYDVTITSTQYSSMKYVQITPSNMNNLKFSSYTVSTGILNFKCTANSTYTHYFTNSLTVKNLYIYSSLIDTAATTNYGFYFTYPNGTLSLATTNNTNAGGILAPSGEAAQNVFGADDKLITGYSGCGTPSLYRLPLALNMTAYSHIVINNQYTATSVVKVTSTDVKTMLLQTPIQVDIYNNGTQLLTSDVNANNHYIVMHCKYSSPGTIALTFKSTSPTVNGIISTYPYGGTSSLSSSNFGDMTNYKTVTLKTADAGFILEVPGYGNIVTLNGTTISAGFNALTVGSVYTLVSKYGYDSDETDISNVGTILSGGSIGTRSTYFVDGASRSIATLTFTSKTIVKGMCTKISLPGYDIRSMKYITINNSSYFGNISGTSNAYNVTCKTTGLTNTTTNSKIYFSNSITITGAYFSSFGSSSDHSDCSYVYRTSVTGSTQCILGTIRHFGRDDKLITAYSGFTPTSLEYLVMKSDNTTINTAYATVYLNGITFTSTTAINATLVDTKTAAIMFSIDVDYYNNAGNKICSVTDDRLYNMLSIPYSNNTYASGIFVTNNSTKYISQNIFDSVCRDAGSAPALKLISSVTSSAFRLAYTTCQMNSVFDYGNINSVVLILYSTGNYTYTVSWYGYSDNGLETTMSYGKYYNGSSWVQLSGITDVTVYYLTGVYTNKTYSLTAGPLSAAYNKYIPVYNYNSKITLRSTIYNDTTNSGMYKYTNYTGNTTSVNSNYVVSILANNDASGTFNYVYRIQITVSQLSSQNYTIVSAYYYTSDGDTDYAYQVVIYGSSAYYWNGSSYVSLASSATIILIII